jgi:hypothetical protein
MVLCDTYLYPCNLDLSILFGYTKLHLGILVLEMEICFLLYCQGYLKGMK